ncbi:Uncharacterised protein [Acinetobacter baumannii]|nr:Uncharacterised protein [Acinetobacter baumannii]
MVRGVAVALADRQPGLRAAQHRRCRSGARPGALPATGFAVFRRVHCAVADQSGAGSGGRQGLVARRGYPGRHARCLRPDRAVRPEDAAVRRRPGFLAGSLRRRHEPGPALLRHRRGGRRLHRVPGAGIGHGRARGGLRAHRHPRLGGNRRGLLPEPGDRALQPQDRVRAGAPASRLALRGDAGAGRCAACRCG